MNDVGVLSDSAGNDILNASVSTAELIFLSTYRIQLAAVDAVYAHGYSGGTNTRNVTNPLAFNLVFDGTWV